MISSMRSISNWTDAKRLDLPTWARHLGLRVIGSSMGGFICFLFYILVGCLGVMVMLLYPQPNTG